MGLSGATCGDHPCEGRFRLKNGGIAPRAREASFEIRASRGNPADHSLTTRGGKCVSAAPRQAQGP